MQCQWSFLKNQKHWSKFSPWIRNWLGVVCSYENDLQAISKLNILLKYADDTTLVVPEHTDVSIHDEFEHVKVWASVNKILLNHLKTKEIVFKRPMALHFHMPPALEEIDQHHCLNCLVCCFKIT